MDTHTKIIALVCDFINSEDPALGRTLTKKFNPQPIVGLPKLTDLLGPALNIADKVNQATKRRISDSGSEQSKNESNKKPKIQNMDKIVSQMSNKKMVTARNTVQAQNGDSSSSDSSSSSDEDTPASKKAPANQTPAQSKQTLAATPSKVQAKTPVKKDDSDSDSSSSSDSDDKPTKKTKGSESNDLSKKLKITPQVIKSPEKAPVKAQPPAKKPVADSDPSSDSDSDDSSDEATKKVPAKKSTPQTTPVKPTTPAVTSVTKKSKNDSSSSDSDSSSSDDEPSVKTPVVAKADKKEGQWTRKSSPFRRVKADNPKNSPATGGDNSYKITGKQNSNSNETSFSHLKGKQFKKEKTKKKKGFNKAA